MTRMRFNFEVLAFVGGKEFGLYNDLLLTVDDNCFLLFIGLLKQHYKIITIISIISEASKVAAITGQQISDVIDIAPKYFAIATLLKKNF